MPSLARLLVLATAARAISIRRDASNSTTHWTEEESDAPMRLMGAKPLYPYDPSTSPHCTWWFDNHDNSVSCADVPGSWGVDDESYLLWNPVLRQGCDAYKPRTSWCVDAPDHPVPGATTTTPPSTTSVASITTTITTPTTTTSPTTIAKPSTTTATEGGSPTPSPIQEGMASNCNRFHLMQPRENCYTLTIKYGADINQLIRWNPAVGSTCQNILTGYYVCVSVRISTPSPTQPPNGIQTPQPIQDGMVHNCNRFHLLESGQNCITLATRYGVTTQQLIQWNPAAGPGCAMLWTGYYACVSVTGSTPSPTQPGNGIQTPTPIQDGMVNNCKGFHLLESGQTCSTLATRYGVSVTQLIQWNPAAGPQCTGLWAGYYACVAVEGGSPTQPGNGVQTPTPIQDGMVSNCNRFHWVARGENCETIASRYGISTGQFISWNPAAGQSCTGLWAETYACVGTK